MVTFRSASVEDLPFLVRLRHATMRRVVENHIPWNDDEQRQRVLLHLDCAKIIVVNGSDAGLWKVIRRDEEIHLCQIQIDQRHQNKGIGTRLIEALELEANQIGMRITLHVYRSNPALGLYRRLGFRIESEDPASLVMAYEPKDTANTGTLT